MVDVGEKPDTVRVAVAKGKVVMRSDTLALIKKNKIPKGDILTLAQVAGINAAKHTWELVPLCHPLLLTDIQVELALSDNAVEITCQVKATGKTGVEMEALTAVCGSALAIYDMAKSLDPAMRIQDVRLVRKSGGKSGEVILDS
jgi:cyclic pyranopterin phosphate synthase